ncbi:DUF1302 domain-containing protein [Idiomarina tyrosinivorans]|uniref:DUF1302 domain-containing protein n=1 Tax=Idiomarina tyrosinivorans TaxID=1445662 RepID=A0A432ZR02_9GAMM|nr:DUF1302 domain-containing protein [Idiomarina tyrosinivorans]RUO80327.1 DUF1302 domain-containing protein [Idiomarina tyrosinivorans]
MLKKLPLAAAIGLTLAASSQAAEFEAGDFMIKFDSILSYGAAWRMEDPNARLYAPGNRAGGLAQSSVGDDGNLNFDKGDLVASVFKGVHDLSIDGDDFGAFLRFKYWYDYVISEQEMAHGHPANNYYPDVTLNDDGFDDYSAGSGFELLDAFVYANFEAGDTPVSLRVGRQVLSWGESTFIFNGINDVNPIDVNAVRRPGAEIKEALLPVGMVTANIGLTANLSMEAFYQYEWDNTKLDGCGTFFSTVDIVGGPGCNKVTLNPTLIPGDSSSQLSDRESVLAGAYIGSSPAIEADDNGQYGVSFRYYSLDLDAEFGAYYMNLHNNTPVISAYNWKYDWQNDPQGYLPEGYETNPNYTYSTPAGYPVDGPRLVIEYPEDTEVFGLSFSTNLGLWSVAGEYSYRNDMPVQINTTEILTAGLRPNVPSTFSDRVTATEPGGLAHGYDRLDVSQAQMSFIRFVDRLWGSDRMTFIGEIGTNQVHDLPSLQEQRYGRLPLYGKCLTAGDTGASADVNCDGFVTENSWGYRTRFVFEYSNVWGGWGLNPTIAFGHDVSGYSPNSNFIEGRKSLGINLVADYLAKYRVSVGYTQYSGGDYDASTDRDFASVSFSYAF